jgi:uncharacterized PurR-regulated membrane protein YhhQ (DUF165 family)
LLLHLLFQFLLLCAPAGCLLLLHLSQFGQNPPAQLPLPTIFMFGALLCGPLYPVSRRLGRPGLLIASLLALLSGAAAALLLPSVTDASLNFGLAGLTALLLTLGFNRLPVRTGAMLSAMTVYVVCTVLANYTFDAFLPVGGFFLVNVGTFFFGITFTQRDRVHQYGRRAVYLMVAVAAVLNVVMSLLIDTPLRYVGVAFLAIIISETADTEIYQRLLDRPWITRVIRSNAVSAPLDTLIFTTLAFWGESFATFGWMVQVIVTDVLVKYGASILVAAGFLARIRLRPR